jgi:C-methyltransferase
MGSAVATGKQPREIIWTTTNGLVAARCLHAVADLGVADHIGAEAVDAAELARLCGADAEALDRVLRLLATQGIFEVVDGGFRHTPASELLRSDHPMSMRAYPRMMNLPVMTGAFAGLDHSLRTGAPAAETVEPRGFWAYFETRPDEARIFGEAMTARAAADIAAIRDAYDFSRFGTIADIGGGRGYLLRAVLDATPGARGVLFDLPPVVAALDFEHERLTTRAGDFFADALPAADAYVLMEVVHDWPDEECVAILSAIRRAAEPGATVLVVENILREDEPDPHGRILDIVMLAVTGGRERTPRQVGALLERAGFTLGPVVDTAGPMRIAEATAV